MPMSTLTKLAVLLSAVASSGCYLFQKSESFYGLQTAGSGSSSWSTSRAAWKARMKAACRTR
jgi:hypothetical protein